MNSGYHKKIRTWPKFVMSGIIYGIERRQTVAILITIVDTKCVYIYFVFQRIVISGWIPALRLRYSWTYYYWTPFRFQTTRHQSRRSHISPDITRTPTHTCWETKMTHWTVVVKPITFILLSSLKTSGHLYSVRRIDFMDYQTKFVKFVFFLHPLFHKRPTL